MVSWIPRVKFLDNTHNKNELIDLLSSTFRRHYITVEQCGNDADTSIVRRALAAASDCSVEINATLNVNVKVSAAFSTKECFW